MNGKEFIDHINGKLGDKIFKAEENIKNEVILWIDKNAVRNVCDYIFNTMKGRFVISSGTDYRQHSDGNFLVAHVFSLTDDKLFIIVHVEVPESDPNLDSITPQVPAAGWAEREIRDIIGVNFNDHPDPRRLIMADDWPEGVYPFRHDFPHDGFPDAVDNKPPFKENPDGSVVFPLGPFYPTLEEPAYFRLFVEGEKIVDCDYRGFYNHKGIEKLGFSELNYNQIPFLAERICGICGTAHSTAYCQAVEMAGEIEVPLRARYIRSILGEFERIHSHLLWLGIAGHVVGFDTVLMQVWRIREPIMWLSEKVTGNRKTYGMNIVGGVRRDIPKEMHAEILEIIDKIDKEVQAVLDAISTDTPLLMRLENVGILKNEDAVKFAALGPTARGSGVAIDERIDHPYAAYDLVEFEKVVETGEDVLARTLVRIKETFQAVSIIRQCIKSMPEGPIVAKIDKPIPPGRVGVSSTEAQRGEAHHYVITGEDNQPIRWKARAPTFQNLQAVPVMIYGDNIADVPLDIASYDPCFSCTERMEVVDVNSGKVKIYSKKDLEKLSRDKNK